METTRFAGIIPPLLTPLTPEEGVDRPAVKRFVESLIAGGVHGLFILGSMGEGAYLRPAVRQEMVEATVEAAAGRVPVIAGVLESGTARMLEEMRRLALPGVAAYVVTIPYYYGDSALASCRSIFGEWQEPRIGRSSPITSRRIPMSR